MAIDKNTVARWASALTLGQSELISDTFDTTKFFAKAPLRIHYAATFNNATAIQIHHLTDFNWICCLQPEDLVGITTGAALVTLVETHLTDQLHFAQALREGVREPGTESAADTAGEELPLVDNGGEK